MFTEEEEEGSTLGDAEVAAVGEKKRNSNSSDVNDNEKDEQVAQGGVADSSKVKGEKEIPAGEASPPQEISGGSGEALLLGGGSLTTGRCILWLISAVTIFLISFIGMD